MKIATKTSKENEVTAIKYKLFTFITWLESNTILVERKTITKKLISRNVYIILEYPLCDSKTHKVT